MMQPANVHSTLEKFQLADGMRFVFDPQRSHGSWLVDGLTGDEYLDAFTCFASWPLGYNHPKMNDPAFNEKLLAAAHTKISNSDLYTTAMAEFVEAFATRVTPEGFDHHFWIDGGGLAVENAMKAAFDWRARTQGRTDFLEDCNDLVILHFRQAFHGRTGYTMSVTNTLPDKIGLFPKFDWPRVSNPFIVFDNDGNIANDVEAEEAKAYKEIEAAFKKHNVAGILVEPLQCEGGDNHFRPEFLAKLRQYADENDCLLLFDEVQTGFFGSGKPWIWQHYGVEPDVVSFGKKTQVCGVYANGRLDDVKDNVFRKSSRINSTWGGNLVDMVRCQRFIEIIEEDNLMDNVNTVGGHVLNGLRDLAKSTGAFTSPRGVGSIIAFTLKDGEERGKMLCDLEGKKVLALPSGTKSVRFRLPLAMTIQEADTLLERTAACCGQLAGA
jgi:L-lysine 6-transaminase